MANKILLPILLSSEYSLIYNAFFVVLKVSNSYKNDSEIYSYLDWLEYPKSNLENNVNISNLTILP